jgi:hypothetical protein
MSAVESFTIDSDAERVLGLLSDQAIGVAVTSSYIGRVLSVDGRSVQKVMAPYLLTGVVQRHYDGKSPNFGTQWWSLPPNSKLSRPVEKGDAALRQWNEPARWTAVLAQIGGRVPMPEVLTKASGAGLRLALWSDGQLVVQRGDESVLFSLEEARVMARYLSRMEEGGCAAVAGGADGEVKRERDSTQIDAEISALRAVRSRVPKFTTFRDDNHAAIDAQVKVLAERMVLEGVQSAWGNDDADGFEHHVLDAAVEAAEWLADVPGGNSPSPSSGWA